MKFVTFIKPMTPYAIGDHRLMPDELAARLEAEGAVAPGAPGRPDPFGRDLAPVPPPAPKRHRARFLTKA